MKCVFLNKDKHKKGDDNVMWFSIDQQGCQMQQKVVYSADGTAMSAPSAAPLFFEKMHQNPTQNTAFNVKFTLQHLFS